MRTAMQWVILASFVSHTLAVLGVTFGEDQKVFGPILSAECCDYEEALPLLLNNGSKNCPGSIREALSGNFEDTKTESEKTCEHECSLGEYGLLNEDKSIKEQRLKELFVEKAHPEVQAVLKGVMVECFNDHNKNTVRKDTCKSGAEDLIQCIFIGILSNCPVSMWNVTKQQCHGSKDKFMSEVATGVTAD